MAKCVHCSREAVFGLKRCEVCLEIMRKRKRKTRDRDRVKNMLAMKKKRIGYKENRQCPSCSARLGVQDDGYVQCVNCRLHICSITRRRGE